MKQLFLVKFGNGKFGIKRGNRNATYLDFNNRTYWWGKNSCLFYENCQSDDYEKVKGLFESYTFSEEILLPIKNKVNLFKRMGSFLKNIMIWS